MKIKYLKGTSNTVADFLSRPTNEINMLESEEATIHSQHEEANDHFPIKETCVNIYKQQIMLTLGNKMKLKMFKEN